MLLAFDGQCVMCNGFVRFLLRHDSHGRLRFTSTETASGIAIFEAHGQDPTEPVSVILVNGDHYYLESNAIILAIAELGGAWKLAKGAMIIPAFVRNPIYRFVARNRYRWFGRLDYCPQPESAFADRFVK